LLSALDAARGAQPEPASRRRRVRAVMSEHFAELVRGLLLRSLVRDHATVGPARELLQAISSLQDDLLRGAHDQPRSETLSQIKMALGALGIGLGPEPIRPGTPLASLMALAGETAKNGGWRHMPAEHGFLSAADDGAVVSCLFDQGAAFAVAPELDGRIPETGVWARYALREAPSRAGPSERLSARVSEIVTLLRLIEIGEADDTTSDDRFAVASYRLGPRCGGAAVECARGRLHHVIELDAQERVVRFEYLAPTEWNFHPRGPVVRSLTGAAVQHGAAGREAIEAAVGSFDPCVGLGLSFREMADA